MFGGGPPPPGDVSLSPRPMGPAWEEALHGTFSDISSSGHLSHFQQLFFSVFSRLSHIRPTAWNPVFAHIVLLT